MINALFSCFRSRLTVYWQQSSRRFLSQSLRNLMKDCEDTFSGFPVIVNYTCSLTYRGISTSELQFFYQRNSFSTPIDITTNQDDVSRNRTVTYIVVQEENSEMHGRNIVCKVKDMREDQCSAVLDDASVRHQLSNFFVSFVCFA